MSLKIFITGTDTNIGKTYTSVRLLKALNYHGLKTVGLKPIASGCISKNGHLYNEDALALQDASSIKLTYEEINPFFFTEPVAPHIMAHALGQELNRESVLQKLQRSFEKDADVFIVEGAGGWYLPLNHYETMAEVVKSAGLKVILVVGLRIGCLSHAILTYKAIQEAKIQMLGWIANCMDLEMNKIDENIQTLQRFLNISYLGMIKYKGDIETINISPLMEV